MHFDLDDEQRAIKETARELLASRFTLEKVRELAESGSYDDGLWSQIAELGWAGIAVPEEDGGQGLGIVELSLLCEEIGYACAPVPLLSSAAAALAIADAGSPRQRERWLGRLASGEAVGAISATPGDENGSLVPDAQVAEVLVLADGDGASVVEAADASIEPLDLIDRTRRYARVEAAGGEPLEGSPAAPLDKATVALAAELTGIAQRAMEMAVSYARERQQFGRAIGAYQAVSHKCARMLKGVEESRSLTLYAAWCADSEPSSLPLAASMAKARASEAAWEVAAASLQVHGGVGFTWEHDLQFFLKRARVAGSLLGSAREHRDRVAALSGLGAREPATVG